MKSQQIFSVTGKREEKGNNGNPPILSSESCSSGKDIDFEWYEKNLKGSVEYEKIKRKYPESYEAFQKKEGCVLSSENVNACLPKSLNTDLPKNVNEEIFKQIESGNINREFVFEQFKGLGETVEHHGFNPNEKRNLTYQQYFTPYPVIEFVTKALNLDSAENVIVFDNSAGMGLSLIHI